MKKIHTPIFVNGAPQLTFGLLVPAPMQMELFPTEDGIPRRVRFHLVRLKSPDGTPYDGYRCGKCGFEVALEWLKAGVIESAIHNCRFKCSHLWLSNRQTVDGSKFIRVGTMFDSEGRCRCGAMMTQTCIDPSWEWRSIFPKAHSARAKRTSAVEPVQKRLWNVTEVDRETGFQVHVYPDFEKNRHLLDYGCVCEPKIELHAKGTLFLHREVQ